MRNPLKTQISLLFEKIIPEMKEGADTVQTIYEKFKAIDFDFEPVQPNPLPVWDYRQQVKELAPAGLLSDCANVADDYWEKVDWLRNPNYVNDESLGRFRNWYGYMLYVGGAGMVKSSEFALGMLVISPDCLYPAHNHLAKELYVPISGRAEWWNEEGEWEIKEPGTPIYHRSWLSHATRTLDEPLLAFFAWLGDSNQHATINK